MTIKNKKYFISALTISNKYNYIVYENRAKTQQQVNAVEIIQNNSICRYRRPPKIK